MANPPAADDHQSRHPVVEHHDSVHAGLPDSRGKRISPWYWLPTANFASGVPYVVAGTASALIAKNMGVSNILLAYWTGLLILPWTFKPFWGPLVDGYWTKRNWMILMQLMLGLALLLTSFSVLLPTTPFGDTGMPLFFAGMIGSLFLVAICSATYDIATDGFYMIALSERQQAWFVGIRSTFYRMAMIAAGGVVPFIAGTIQNHTGLEPQTVQLAVVPAGGIPGEPLFSESPLFKSSDQEQRIILSSTQIQSSPGDEVYLYARLGQQVEEGREVVVTTQPWKTPKGFKIIGGDRIAFDSSNWDQPTTITLGSDKSINKISQAEYRVAAGNIPLSWNVVIGSLGVVFLLLSFYHRIVLPYPAGDRSETAGRPPFYQPLFWLAVTMFPLIIIMYFATRGLRNFGIFAACALVLGVWLYLMPELRRILAAPFHYTSERSGIGFAHVFATFFKKHKIAVIVAFILLFRLGESQIVKLGQPFMLDSRDKGGLALSVQDVGLVYNTVGVCCLLVGGIIGGLLISTYGLKKVIWPLVACMHVPNLLYVYMAIGAANPPFPLWQVYVCVGIEQMGYGIGFASFMMYLIFAAQGEFKTSHYALCTGFMSLGMMIPFMLSGYLHAAAGGYPKFFILACIMVIPGVLLIPFLPMDESFGRKAKPTP